jgi:CBS domain-containing protein
MPTEIKVKEAMLSGVIIGKPTQTIKEIAVMMKKEDVGMIVIVDGGKPAGTITREDIIDKVVAVGKDPNIMKAKDIMGFPVVTVSPEDDLATVSRLMVKYGYERMPVVSMGKLVGLISDREIAKIAPAAIEILRERLFVEGEPAVVEEFNSGECELCANFNEQLHKINDRWVCDACKDEAAEL